MKIAISGATGRMGLAVARLAQADSDIEIVGGAAAPNDPNQGRDIGELAGIGSVGVAVTADMASALLSAEVVIDFSVASVVKSLVQLAVRSKIAVVSGTTNLDADAKASLDKAAQTIPILWAPNMSLGVQVLAELTEHALRRLGPTFDAEIVEIHHRKKIDAPSGTALRIAEAISEGRGTGRDRSFILAREGETGARPAGSIGVLALRGGDNPGEHTAIFLGQGERLELIHRSATRDHFARGALRAAAWVLQHPPGLYDMEHVIGLRPA